MQSTPTRLIRSAARALGLKRHPGAQPRPPATRDPAEPPARIDQLLFICGLHRSGTTAIEEYVSATYEVSYLRAPVPENEGQFLQDVYPAAALHGGPGRFAFHAEMYPAPPEPAEAAVCRDRLLSAWGDYVQGDAPTLSEKSPPNLTKIPYLRAIFPGARFLVVARDPRAVAAATQKWSNTSLEELMLHWTVAYGAAIEALGDDCHVLRYEDFCEDPMGAFAKAGLDGGLTRRATPLPVPERFARLENTNAKYYDRHSCPRYGPGAWAHFGYDL
ncbi:MAG: sulfotransferase [Pseudomonadota bacterium]